MQSFSVSKDSLTSSKTKNKKVTASFGKRLKADCSPLVVRREFRQ